MRACSFAICLAMTLVGQPAAQAVLIQTVSGTGNVTVPPDDPGWANVGVLGVGTGIYLGDGWVLTASHVGVGPLVLSGTTYAAQAGTTVQLTNGGSPGRTTLTDLILFRLEAPPAGLSGLTIAATTPADGTPVTMIGAGRDRGPFTEWSIDTGTEPPTWTVVPSGGDAAGYLTDITRAMRWGTNAIDSSDVWVRASDLVPPLDVLSIATVFDVQPGGTEAQAVFGDSGGGLFVKNDMAWELAGLIFDVAAYAGQPVPGGTAVFGNLTYSADLSFYRPQIMAIVPEPGYLAVVAGGLGAILFGTGCAHHRRGVAGGLRRGAFSSSLRSSGRHGRTAMAWDS